MTKISVQKDKKWYESKTVWANLMIITAGVLTAVAGQLETGVPITVAGVLNILLRTVTKSPLLKELI